WRVVVQRVDDAVGDIQDDGELAGPHQVSAPPVALAVVVLDPLDEDQPVRVGLEYGVAGPLGGQPPVGGQVAVAPAGYAVRLIVQIGADDRRVAGVALRLLYPVFDPR